MSGKNYSSRNIQDKVGRSFDQSKGVIVQFLNGQRSMDSNQLTSGFSIRIENQSPTKTYGIAIHPASFDGRPEEIRNAGVPIVATLADGEFHGEDGHRIKASSSPVSPFVIKTFLNKKPTKIGQINVKTTEAQLEQPLYISRHYLLQAPTTGNPIIPSDFVKETNTVSGLVKLTNLSDFQLDDETVLSTEVLPGTTVTYTFFPIAALNSAATMRKISK